MDIAGLVFGTVPIAIQLCQYFKKVKEHGENRDQLIKKFELYIAYAQQVQEKTESGDENFRQATKGRLQAHNAVLQNLQDLLKNPDLQSFMDRSDKAEQNDQDDGNQSDINSTMTIASATGSQRNSNPALKQDEDHGFSQALRIKYKRFKQKGKGKLSAQSGNHCDANSSDSTSGSPQIIIQHPPPSLAKTPIDPWMWPFRESQFLELLKSLEQASDILDKVLHLEILDITVSINKEVTANRKQVEELRDIQSSAELEIRELGEKLRRAQEKKERNAASEWLSPLTFWHTQDEAFERFQAGTGQWLLEDESFQKLLRGELRSLLCHGMPGAGKTILASLVINHLTERIGSFNTDKASNDRIHALAFIYYNYNDQPRQTLSNILGSILRQLEAICTIEPDLVKLHRQYQKQKRKLPLTELIARLKKCIAACGMVFIVIDALDECEPEHRRELLGVHVSDLLKEVPNVRIFATSRPLDDIQKFYRLKGYSQLSIRATDEDIKLYLHSQIERLRVTRANLPEIVGRDIKFQKDVIGTICARCEGMFLLAQLYITSLVDIPTRAKLSMAVERLPKGLDATYVNAVKRIQERSEYHWHVARRAFMWILYAAEPTALQHDAFLQALATSCETGLNRDDILETGHLLTICGGLVVLQAGTGYQEKGSLQFIHYSTQEFFENNPSILFSESARLPTDMAQYVTRAHTELAMTCLGYLATPLNTKDVTTGLLEQRTEAFPFLDYASLNWGIHAAQSQQAMIRNMVFALFDKCCQENIAGATAIESALDSYTLYHLVLAKIPVIGYLSDIRGKVIPLYNEMQPQFIVAEGYKSRSALVVAAAFGLSQLLQEYLDHRQDKCTSFSQAKRGYICTAAAYHDAVEILHWVERTYPEEDFNSVGLLSAPPLWVAARSGRGRIVAYLLSKQGINRNQPHILSECTPLIAAAKSGHLAAVKMLLAYPDVDVNRPDVAGITPLYVAVRDGKADMVKLLLAREDVDVNRPDKDGKTPLCRTSLFGSADVVKLILARADVDVNKPNASLETPLYTAAARGVADVVKLLLTRADVDVNKVNSNRETPLNAAAAHGRADVVKLLLARADVDVNKPDRDRGAPLYAAASGTKKADVVKLLLAREDVDVNRPDKDGKTPLYVATLFGSADVVKLMLARADVDVNKSKYYGRTPLYAAAAWGPAGVVKLLLAREEVDVNKSNENGETPLYAAAARGVADVVKLLLARADVDVNKPNENGETPLYAAAARGVAGVVKLLLARVDVDVNRPDRVGKTPLYAAASNKKQADVVKLLLARADVDVNRPDKDGKTPLYVATLFRSADMVKLLFARADVDVNIPGDDGNTPLYVAALFRSVDMVKLLLARADVDVNKPNYYSKTPLNAAAACGGADVVELLLARADVDVNKPNSFGKTPLNSAAACGGVDVVKFLLARTDVDVNRPNASCETPLYTAAARGVADVVKLLLARADVDVNQSGKYSKTPLFRAVETGKVKVVQQLLARADVDVNQPDFLGMTPLYMAAVMGNVELVQLLLARADVDPTIRDKDGRGPLDIASRDGYQRIAGLLRSRLEQSQSKEQHFACGEQK